MSDSNNDFVVSLSWDDESDWTSALKKTETFKIAMGEFTTRRSHPPNLQEMQSLLASFIYHPPEDYFADPDSDEANAFEFVKTEAKIGWSRGASTARDKKRTTAFVARYLAILLVLHEKEKKAREDAKKPLDKSADEQPKLSL